MEKIDKARQLFEQLERKGKPREDGDYREGFLQQRLLEIKGR